VTRRDLLSLAASSYALQLRSILRSVILFRIADVSLPFEADQSNATNDLSFLLTENCRADDRYSSANACLDRESRFEVRAIRKFSDDAITRTFARTRNYFSHSGFHAWFPAAIRIVLAIFSRLPKYLVFAVSKVSMVFNLLKS